MWMGDRWQSLKRYLLDIVLTSARHIHYILSREAISHIWLAFNFARQVHVFVVHNVQSEI
jgi:hypothetical protein